MIVFHNIRTDFEGKDWSSYSQKIRHKDCIAKFALIHRYNLPKISRLDFMLLLLGHESRNSRQNNTLTEVKMHHL